MLNAQIALASLLSMMKETLLPSVKYSITLSLFIFKANDSASKSQFSVPCLEIFIKNPKFEKSN